ncbi:MAG: NIPSNAP family protein [Planctomycetota bacterium]|jgi:hypothetical protein
MMRRRRLLGAVCLVSLAGACTGRRGAEAAGKAYIELRHYTVEIERRTRLDEFLSKVAIPAWNRIGIANVGVFEKSDGKDANLYVLLSHRSIEEFASSRQRLLADRQFMEDGAPYLDLPMKDPLYSRIESSLMLGFDECPRIEVPKRTATRVFQLRIYESHSLKKGQKKVDMFDAGGEIAIFRDCGMQPVFFGETLVGTKIPNLTYMLVFEDDEAQKASWNKFKKHPEWHRIRKLPVYKDTVSNITNILLKPTSYSQL